MVVLSVPKYLRKWHQWWTFSWQSTSMLGLKVIKKTIDHLRLHSEIKTEATFLGWVWKVLNCSEQFFLSFATTTWNGNLLWGKKMRNFVGFLQDMIKAMHSFWLIKVISNSLSCNAAASRVNYLLDCRFWIYDPVNYFVTSLGSVRA